MNGPYLHHVPVMPAEVCRVLIPQPGQVFVDATVGVGGHARLLLEKLGPTGRLIGLDRDAAMLDLARTHLQDFPVTLVQANFADLATVLKGLQLSAVDGIVADLGFCSDQLEDPRRGFSFRQNGPLDMRMDPAVGEPACSLLQRLSERELADLFWHYGEERFSRRIARKIIESRRRTPIETTFQLAELVRSCVPRPRGKKARIDPATRVFQALRIAVNDELECLDHFLAAVPGCLKAGGRIAVVSFHSLEDRRVKQAFRNKELYEVITRKPLRPSAEEIRNNPRARSAKLRAAKKRGEAYDT